MSTNYNSTNIEIEREQFPLQLAYAMTVHKSQGQELQEVIVDFAPREGKKPPRISPGLFYVAITRVRRGDQVFLTDYNPLYIQTNAQIINKINAMKIQSKYEFFKVNLYEPIFQNDADTKIGYLNINGLNEVHASYINMDQNLQNLDVLCIAETKLKLNTVTTLSIEYQMTNWTVHTKYDAQDGKEHMGLIILTSKLKH